MIVRPAPGEARRSAGDGPGNTASLPRGRSPLFKVLGVVLAVFFFLVFVTLGTWQVKRRAWKLDLIARVEQRVHAPAVAAPGSAHWSEVTAATDEYRHVTATGAFLDSSQTLVQAVTDLGAGYWVLTPLQAGDGNIVLVNRGFVAADDRGRVQPGGSGVTVTGLLRLTEPGGAFLRHNSPATNQWYSRDVAAIAAKRGLTHVAPYFIDAEAAPAPTVESRSAGPSAPSSGAAAGTQPLANAAVPPTPGLTVIHFHNSHLVYAITWYTLALMTAIAIPVGMRKQ